MPQHPKYSNSPEKNLVDLNNLLYELEKFGFIHEEIDRPIRSLISSLNPEAFAKHTLARNWLPIDSNIEDYDEDEIEYEELTIKALCKSILLVEGTFFSVEYTLGSGVNS